jgi:small subunit ribosomal protein S8
MNTDPIADMLTRIRNAGRAGHPRVSMPASGVKLEIARVLQEEGYLRGFRREEGLGYGTLYIDLKYTDREFAITGLKRESTPGQRRYVKAAEIPKVLNGFGVAVVSTSKGVLSGQAARAAGVGGELICTVW